MTERTAGHFAEKKEIPRREKVFGWFHSPSFKCFLMDLVSFLLILVMFFFVCVPKKYSLSVGSISHDTINATKDVVDEVGTQEKKNAAAAQVEPTYRFQQGIKEEVMSSLSNSFNELRTIQQYGLTLRSSERSRPNSFSEDEIAYAIGLLKDLTLNRNQIVTLLRVDTDPFDDMVSTVSTAVENSMNSSVREGQISQAIQTILQIVGFKVDISLTQNILPAVLRACIKPNMIIDQEATDEARAKAMESVEPIIYLQGQNIIREGDRITGSQIEMIR
jgi:membrane-associated HD superfamily phosphohydrolase